MSRCNEHKQHKISIFIICLCILLMSVLGVAYGESYIQPKDEMYSSVFHSVEGIRRVIAREGNLSGFIDEEGTPITPMIFEIAWDFEKGRAMVCEQGRWKQIDPKGEVLLELDPSYKYIHSYNGESGIASRTDGRVALIDASGKPLTGFEYAGIMRYPLNKSLFLATKDPDEKRSGQEPWNDAWSKYGLLSSDGRELTSLQYYLLGGSGDTGAYPQLLTVSHNLHGAGGSCGYLDENGKEILPLIYDVAGDFSEGIGYVRGASSKYALVDTSGKLLTDFAYDGIWGVHEGLSVVTDGEKYSVIDRNGATLLSDIGDPQDNFQNGYLKTVRTGNEILVESPIKQSRRTHLYVNDLWIYTDQELLIVNNRVLIPVRQFADAIGYTVSWNSEEKMVTIQNKERIIRMRIGKPCASVNVFDDGKPEETVEMDVPPRISDGRTLIPLRFAAETFGADVEWRADSRSVMVNT